MDGSDEWMAKRVPDTADLRASKRLKVTDSEHSECGSIAPSS